jgi:hypothetical protein
MGQDTKNNKQMDEENRREDEEHEHNEHHHEKEEHHTDSVEEETIKLEQDLQKLSALQYLLNDDSFDELNQEVSIIKKDPNVSSIDKYVA